ncbi:hypothetical protein KPH14_003346 [Odynerus spinipes]|uniref:Uncharacterized protein n=1 Tax=Odynerus spinipes TaxID=1348599 RepID=A0AAD9RD10_9HYME|nr:hypothetical protein KPH14_003346 [Odynerus spinipes]
MTAKDCSVPNEENNNSTIVDTTFVASFTNPNQTQTNRKSDTRSIVELAGTRPSFEEISRGNEDGDSDVRTVKWDWKE